MCVCSVMIVRLISTVPVESMGKYCTIVCIPASVSLISSRAQSARNRQTSDTWQPPVTPPMRSFMLTALLASTACALRVPLPRLTRRDVGLAASAALLLPAGRPALADAPGVAISAVRFSIEPKVSPLLGGLGEIGYSRFEDQLSTPKGAASPSVGVRFDYPSQWQRLPPQGQITLVDGNSGLKLYVLTAKLPGTGLLDTPKAWFGSAIFSPDGAIAKSGTMIDDFKVSSAKELDVPTGCVASARRRFALKYTVITPANQRTVDRRAFADAYEIDGVVYILLASGNSAKWEGTEKERCERCADSFLVGGA